MSSITIVSDASDCCVTCDIHSDDSSYVIYDHNMFIVQATEGQKLECFKSTANNIFV